MGGFAERTKSWFYVEDEANEPVVDGKKRPGRGVETLFRTLAASHLELSSLADSKASLMISINAIIVSLVVSGVFGRLEQFPNLVLPTALLTLVSLLTIVFAVLATRPQVETRRFGQEDPRANLLFFDTFHRLSLEEYVRTMRQALDDRDVLYTRLMHDLYFQGKVLARKYQLLRIAYTIFLFGFVLSVLAYAAAFLFFSPP